MGLWRRAELAFARPEATTRLQVCGQVETRARVPIHGEMPQLLMREPHPNACVRAEDFNDSSSRAASGASDSDVTVRSEEEVSLEVIFTSSLSTCSACRGHARASGTALDSTRQGRAREARGGGRGGRASASTVADGGKRFGAVSAACRFGERAAHVCRL